MFVSLFSGGLKGHRMGLSTRLTQKFVGLFILLGLTFLVHGGAVANWWCCDDTQILGHAIRYAPNEYFFVPDAWRSLVAYSLTPWLTLVYEVDLALAGIEPYWFYAHNLLVIALCGWSLQLIASEWVDPVPAFAGSVLFLIGVPITLAAHQLMVRQYLEGMLFFLLAVWLVIQGVKRDRLRWGVAAGVAFAIAASAKEIYLPLAFLVFLMPLADFRRRLAVAWPLLFVIALYVPWRRYMLGDTVGGYSPSAELGALALLESFIGQLVQAPGLLWSSPAIALSAMAIAAAMVLRLAGAGILPGSGWLLLLPILLLAPLFPLTVFPGLGPGSERYYIAIWAACSLTLGVLLGLLCRHGRWVTRILAITLFCAVAYPASLSTTLMRDAMRSSHVVHSAIGKAIATSADDVVIVTDAHTASWFNLGVLDLRGEMGMVSPPPLVVPDLSELATSASTRRRVLRFSPETGAMADITATLPDLMQAWRNGLRPDPLSVDIEFDAVTGVLRWRLSVDRPGRFVLIETGGQTPVPPTGALRTGKPPQGCFRIRFDSLEGWSVYSAPLLFELVSRTAPVRLRWRGNGEMFDRPAATGCAGAGRG